MNEQLNRPKDFGELLDLTFRLCKNHFSGFFMILLIVLGPIYIFEAILLSFAGTSFFQEMSPADAIFGQFRSNLAGNESFQSSFNFGLAGIGSLIVGMATLVLLPVTRSGVLIAVHQIKDNQDFTAGSVIKRSFSKFWPILGCSLLFGIIVFGMSFVGVISPTIIGAVLSATINSVLGIGVGILLFIGVAIVAALLITRWSLFLGSVVIDNDAPGLTRSWHLTTNRTWKTLGFFIVVFIITSIIGGAVGGITGILLGGSVLSTIINDLVSLLTSMIFSVAYAVIYFDMKIRHDGDDLKDMIEDYEGTGQ